VPATGPVAGPADPAAAGPNAGSGRKLAAVVATLLTITIVGGVAFAVSTAIRRSPALVAPPASTTLSTGSKVPVDFTLSRLGATGSSSLAALLGGHPAVVNFFASWCTICQQEMTTLGASARSYGSAVRFIGIDTDDSAPGAAIAISKRAGIDYLLYRDPGGETVATAYGANHLPTTFVVDRSGHLVTAILGAVTRAKLAAALDPLVTGRGH
jgi:thiol-disulfide isomerase/thioredoxin